MKGFKKRLTEEDDFFRKISLTSEGLILELRLKSFRLLLWLCKGDTEN